MRRLVYDVQRDAPFYRATVVFRNAVEQMILRRRTTNANPGYPDRHLFWGFEGRDDNDRFDADDDGLAPSPVPLRPHGSSGAAGAAVEQPTEEVEAQADSTKLSA